MLPWRSITPGLALLAVVALTRTAHADRVAVPPPVSPTPAAGAAAPAPVIAPPTSGCAFEGYGPDVCKDLPIAQGVCIAVGATAGSRITDMLTKEGFSKRCTGESFNSFGPEGHKACEQQTLSEWCRDAPPDGLASGRAELCDLESYAGCQVAQRVNSRNARVVEKVCLERAEMLRGAGQRDSWERCKATWEANGVALPGEPTAGAAKTTGVAASSGCGLCAVGDGDGVPAGLVVLVGVGLGWSRRRRPAA